ncbi:hypothetical protein VC87395_003455A, partial [Vibrio paracholerae 87395]
MVTVVAFEFSV